MARIHDYEQLARDLVEWLDYERGQAGALGFVVGLSGGADSAVCAALCQRTRSPTLALILPCESEEEEITAARATAAALGLTHDEIPLEDLWRQMLLRLVQAKGTQPLETVFPDEADREQAELRAAGNLKSRLRMAACYTLANAQNLLVVGSATRSDISLGYLTKHGDSASADLLPLAELLKSEVRSLGYFLDVPPAVLGRMPSGDLWEGQSDEKELGLRYDQIEPFLVAHSDDDYANAGYVTYLSLQPHEIEIVRRLKQHQHKIRRAARFEPQWARYAGVSAKSDPSGTPTTRGG